MLVSSFASALAWTTVPSLHLSRPIGSPQDIHSRATLDGLVPILYDELREAARHQLAVRAAGDTLSTTDLVHETYLETRPGDASRVA